MGIRFLCPACSRKLNIKAHLGGKRGICPFCQAKLLIPSDSRAAPDSAAGAVDEGSVIVANGGPAESVPPTAVALPLDPPNPRDGQPAPPLLNAHPAQPADRVGDRVGAPTGAASEFELPPALAADPQATWYVGTAEGRQFGPADAHQMWQWLGEGRVPPDSLVWRDGWEQWQPMGEVFVSRPLPAVEPVSTPPPLRVTPAASELPVARAIPVAEGPLASVSLVAESTGSELPVDSHATRERSSAKLRLRARRKQWRLTTTAVLILLLGASILLIAVLFYVLAVGPIEL